MQLLGTAKTDSQTLATGAVVDIGSIYRRCGCSLTSSSSAIALNRSGIYHITATFVGSGTASGTASIRMNFNGVAIPRAVSSETITTPSTEVRTFVIDEYVLVSSASVVSFTNVGVGITLSLSKVNIEKVV